MCQWVEREIKRERHTDYEYKLEWRSDLVQSGNFRDYSGQHDNPPQMPYYSHTTIAESAELGGFVLGKTQIQKLNKAVKLNYSDHL